MSINAPLSKLDCQKSLKCHFISIVPDLISLQKNIKSGYILLYYTAESCEDLLYWIALDLWIN